jgi:hypothetical protein
MTYREVLAATAAEIIHTTVQLCLTSCYCCVCMDMVRYAVEQHVFLYESYVKCGCTRKCRRNFRRKFTGITGPSTTDIHELVNKVRSTGSLLDKKPV